LQAQLRNADYAPVEQERYQLAERNQILRQQAEQLTLSSNISGVVVTPRVQDLVGSYLKAGAEAMEVADISAMEARIYVAESDLRKISMGSPTSIHIDGLGSAYRGTVTSITSVEAQMEEGVMEKQYYTGLHPPRFYLAEITVQNSNAALKIGMTGVAKIFLGRRSLAGLATETVANLT